MIDSKLLKQVEDFITKEGLDITASDLLSEEGFIKKVGKEWCVFSESGKDLGCEPTLPEARDRLKKIEMFKHMDSSDTETASQDCYCPKCGAFSETNGKCIYATCPNCAKISLVKV